jgi:hypothetical protein
MPPRVGVGPVTQSSNAAVLRLARPVQVRPVGPCREMPRYFYA